MRVCVCETNGSHPHKNESTGKYGPSNKGTQKLDDLSIARSSTAHSRQATKNVCEQARQGAIEKSV